MPARTSLLKAAVAAIVTTLSPIAASAEALTVEVYEYGYLPNILYMGDATEVTFVNKSRWTLGVDYFENGSPRVIVNLMGPGESETIPRSELEGLSIAQPMISGYGYYGRGTFEIRDGYPPLN